MTNNTPVQGLEAPHGSMKVTALSEREGESLRFLDAAVTVKMAARDGADYGLLEYRLASGSSTPFHRHLAEDEAIFVLEGELRLELEERVIHACRGSYVHLPRGTAHGLHALTDARLLVLSRPDGFVEFVRAAGHRLGEPQTRELTMERLMQLAAQHQIEILGPLPSLAAELVSV